MITCAPFAKSPTALPTAGNVAPPAISVLETQHPEFRQRTVDNLKGCLAVTDIAERDVPFFGRLIDQDRMALAERPSRSSPDKRTGIDSHNNVPSASALRRR